jgi:hypothetical protein
LYQKNKTDAFSFNDYPSYISQLEKEINENYQDASMTSNLL